MLKSTGEKLRDIYKKSATAPVIVMVIVIVIISTLSFGLGYLYRGEVRHVPIIIEKHS